MGIEIVDKMKLFNME